MTSNPITLSKRSQFWIFQTLGWSVWVALLSFRDLFVYPEFLIPRILCWGLIALIGMVLTYGLRALYRLVWERGFVVRFLVTWFGSLTAAVLCSPSGTASLCCHSVSFWILVPPGRASSLMTCSCLRFR